MDLAAAIDQLVPSADYQGSATGTTQAEYDALRWNDVRTKPAWTEIEASLVTVNIEQLRQEKIDAVKAEGLRRMQLDLPGIKDIDTLELVREMWLSIAVGSRAATVTFQKMIDIYQAARSAITTLKGYTTEAEITAYDPITDPAWPA